MINLSDISNYTVVGTLVNNKDITVYIAHRNDAPSDELYIINRFPRIKENDGIFKSFFSYYSLQNKSKHIANFFASQKHFFIVFNYQKCDGIKAKFSKEITTESFEKRCELLSDILIKINNISDMPILAVASASKSENICVNSDNKIYFMYNLWDALQTENLDKSTIFKNITSIVKIMLQHEIESRYNKQLHIVVEKCENNLYKSIPELIVELEKAEEKCKDNNLKTHIMRFIKNNKRTIKIVVIISIIVLVIVGGFFLLRHMIYGNQKISSSDNPIIAVGNTSYTSDPAVDKQIDTYNGSTDSSSSTSHDLSVAPDVDIPSEDYIVQYGDTIESICKNHYNSTDFIKTIETYNSIQSGAKLIAGTVLKLPDKSSVLDYVLH